MVERFAPVKSKDWERRLGAACTRFKVGRVKGLLKMRVFELQDSDGKRFMIKRRIREGFAKG